MFFVEAKGLGKEFFKGASKQALCSHISAAYVESILSSEDPDHKFIRKFGVWVRDHVMPPISTANPKLRLSLDNLYIMGSKIGRAHV